MKRAKTSPSVAAASATGAEDPPTSLAEPLPIVAILGRPNVGKSTLFNRIVGKQEALVEDRPGVTRDRHYGEADWDNRRFTLVDTGGFSDGEIDALATSVRQQAEIALRQATLALLVIDGRVGVNPDDQALVEVVRRSGKPVLIVANKIDERKVEERAELGSIYALGFPEVFAVSAAHGRGVNDLLDAVLLHLPDASPEAAEEDFEPQLPLDDGVPVIAVVGRPNAGKSTLLNQVLGEARLVVSELPGTTRDAIEVETERDGRRFRFIDTAGVRRKSGHGDSLEQETAVVAKGALARADVVVVLFDATEPAVEQDARLLGECLERSKPMVLAANKVDKLTGPQGRQALREAVDEHLKFVFAGAPIVELSARNGTGLTKLLEVCNRLFEQSNHRIPTPEMNRFLREAEDAHPAPRHGGHLVRLYYMAQVSVRPPTFLIHVNRPEGITEAYKRFLENRMREHWKLEIPLRLVFRKRRR